MDIPRPGQEPQAKWDRPLLAAAHMDSCGDSKYFGAINYRE